MSTAAAAHLRRTVTASVLLALGIGFTMWSAQIVANAYAVRFWPTTQGEVTASELVSVVEPSDVSTMMHTARVEYAYAVGSNSYTGSRVTFADHSSSSHGEMAGVLARYPVGSQVPVRYDPDDPGSAILETRIPLPVYAPLLLGLLAMVAGAVAVVRSRA